MSNIIFLLFFTELLGAIVADPHGMIAARLSRAGTITPLSVLVATRLRRMLGRVLETAQFNVQVQHLLTNPKIIAFLREAPQARRRFRALCRGLGLVPLPEPVRPAPPGRPAIAAPP